MDGEVCFNKCTENVRLMCSNPKMSVCDNGEDERIEMLDGYLFGDSDDIYADSFWEDVDAEIKGKSGKETLIQLINENPTFVPMLLNHLGSPEGEVEINVVAAIRMVRKGRLQKRYMEQGKDVVIDLIVTKYDEYFAWCKKREMMGTKQTCCSTTLVNCHELWNRFEAFHVELNAMVSLILEEDFASENPKYLDTLYVGACVDHEGNTRETKASILHFAACRNLTEVMAKILAKQSTLWSFKDCNGNLPLFSAIQKSQDAAASLLIQHMPNEEVRRFLEEGRDMNPPLFTQIIRDSVGMQKTVESILDSFIDPDWSFLLPPRKRNKNAEAVHNIQLPSTSTNHMFHYGLLDMNEDGTTNSGCRGETKSCLRRLVEGKCDKNLYNPYHAWRQTSFERQACKKLHAIDVYTTNQDPMLRHPVVMMLMHSKWESFGKLWVYKVLAASLLFLFLLTFALFLKPSTPDRRSYTTNLDKGRLVCEILSLVMVCGYGGLEVNSLVQHKKKYFMNLSNLFDVASCALILFGVVPLRLAGGHMAKEFYVSSAAYLISFVRISYMACLVSKSMSIYIYALYTIVLREISRFLIIFAIFMFSFGGSVYLALKGFIADTLVEKYGTNSTLVNDAFMKNTSVVRGYAYSILQEIRVLAEGNGYAETEQYMRLTPAVLGFIMLNMFCGLVVLDNILIGQIGNAYASALENAKIRYDVGRVKLCSYIEDSWSTDACCTTKRVKFFKTGELLSDKELEKELGDCWSAFKSKVRKRSR